jgi:ribonuclease HII
MKEEIDLLEYERKLYEEGYNLICGTDEAGRGPLVGPVVAAAVIMPKNYHLDGLNDSKKLTEKKREELFPIIKRDAISYGIAVIDAKTIDKINILEASRLGMTQAITSMSIKPEYILSDAMKLNFDIPVLPIIHGCDRQILWLLAKVG